MLVMTVGLTHLNYCDVMITVTTLTTVNDIHNLNFKVMLLKTLVLTHLNYCNVVTTISTVSYIPGQVSERLQYPENDCVRFIFNIWRRDQLTTFYHQLSLLKLKEICDFHTLCHYPS